MSPTSKEKNKQEHEEVSAMVLEKMKTKDSSPEEQTESLQQGHPKVANLNYRTCNFKMYKGKKAQILAFVFMLID